MWNQKHSAIKTFDTDIKEVVKIILSHVKYSKCWN
jgi:hypothetical protein